MKTAIIGRKQECARLDKCMREGNSQLVIVYGRRRVGKTFLINEYFHNRFAFKLTGAYGESKAVQLESFTVELNRKTHQKNKIPQNWRRAFEMLREYIESLPRNEKCIVFFDEMPWLDTHKSGFLSAFEFFWNDYGSTVKNLVFIVCGSATSWLTEHIDHNRGGLFNRQTCKLFLEPFNLRETEEYLLHKGIRWSRYDIVECYMVLGGIPYYLSLLDKELSYLQNIDYLCFKKRAELWDEFDHLYHTLFSREGNHVLVVEELSKKGAGLTRAEVAQKTGLAPNGVLSKVLKNLVDSGFVRENISFGKKKKEILYQLSDYYSCFYFRYLKNRSGRDEHYWSNTLNTPSRKAWAGITFEQVCKDHIRQIKRKLGISGIVSEQYSWFVRPDQQRDIRGAQIDLIIDRRDRVITLCEIKFSLDEFTINRDYEAKIRNRIETFRTISGTKKAIQIAFITTYGVKTNMYSSIIQKQININDLFAETES